MIPNGHEENGNAEKTKTERLINIPGGATNNNRSILLENGDVLKAASDIYSN